MRVIDFLAPDCIIAALQAKTKPAVLSELSAHLAKVVPGVEAEALRKVLEEREQPAEGVSLAPKVTVEEAEVRWADPAQAVGRAVRACTPAPGAWTWYAGERVKVGPVVTDPDAPALAPGELAVGKNSVHVGTGSVPVRLGEVKAHGRKQMAAADWARGARVPADARFGA